MEFFLELVLTLTVPLLIYFFVTKFLSRSSAAADLALPFGFGSRIHNLKSCNKPSVAVVLDEDSVGDDAILECRSRNSGGILETRGETETNRDDAVIESVKTVDETVGSDSDNHGGDCGGLVAEKVFDESSVRARVEETGICRDEDGGVEAFESDRSKESGGSAAEEEIVVEDDDWEGIERTELDKRFEAAVKFVKILESEDPSFCNELKMRLSVLHKIAVEGPCTESPTMALKIFAPSKWNTWKQLGNLSPEVAMERYINLVSENIPGWKQTLPVNSDQDASHTRESEKLAFKTDSL